MPVSIVSAANYNREIIREALAKAFQLLGMNAENPFKGLIKPGDRVFIKPNWVAHRYRASCPNQHDVYTTITHPAIIRAVIELVDTALDGKGLITLGDNPSIDADFNEIIKLGKFRELSHNLKTRFRILDLRPLVCNDLKDYGKRDKMCAAPGDPEGLTELNLGKDSLLFKMNPRLLRGVFDEREETVGAHSGDTQLYGFSNSIFKSDVFISIPKLKTHHKVGTTLNLKGLVGTIGTKNYLVHWREGFPLIGGDAYPNFRMWLKDKFTKVKKRGAWPGNDTIWRMVVDLYNGIQRGPKTFFSVVDGVLGGEGNGPFCPEPKESRVLIAGTDLLETDIAASRLMGFNIKQIKYLDYFISSNRIRTEDIRISSDDIDCNGFFDSNRKFLNFKPPANWENLIEG